MKFVLLLIALLIAVVSAVPVEFTDCAPGSIVTLKSFEASMWPPQKNVEFTMVTSAVANAAVSNGEWIISTTWAGMNVDKQTGDLAQFGDISLPIQPGAFKFTNVGTLPGNSPSGQYIMTTKATSNGNDVFCYKINFKL